MARHRAMRVVLSVLVAALAALGPHAQSAQDDGPITFRIIVVSTAERAAQLGERLRQGADFADLARAESLDPSAPQGGLIGPIPLSELRGDLADALRTAAPNEVRGVIALPTGFALVQRVVPAMGPAIRGVEVLALSSAGSVKATVSVDGFAEAQTALNNLTKPATWNQDPRLICRYRDEAVERVKASLDRVLAPGAADLRAGFTPIEILEGHISYGQLFAFRGDMGRAVEQFELAHRLALLHSPEAAPDIEQMIGAALLHKAELDNGIYHAPGDRCLLSIRGASRLSRADDLDRAVARFQGILGARPGDLEARWLLNAAFLATGGFPALVPPPFLIPPATFASSADAGRFRDVAGPAGIESFSSAGGVVVDDFDNDGAFEILTSNFDSCGQMQLFARDRQGRFVDRAGAAGLGDQLGGLNLAQADVDNDGCTDVLVMRGGWELAQRRSLLRNNCDGTFTDVTASAGLLTPVTSSQTAVWSDVDNDGWVDLFVGNEDAPAQLFLNRRNGTFEDIAEAAGVRRTAFTKAVAAGDFNNDGFQDLYVSNFRGGNVLYRNNGNRTFTDVTAAAGVAGADRGFPAWFFDYDNDGWDDIFASSYYLSIEESARSYLRLPPNAATMKLYRNQRNGTFRDVTSEARLDRVYMPMGSNFGDIDNDGFLDIYLGTGSPSYVALVPSVMLRNNGGGSFDDVTESSGTGEMHKGHGVAFADLDNDGDQEIAFKVGGATPGDAHAFRLFENPGHGNRWLRLTLVGVASNRGAIGARVTATVEDPGGAHRRIHRPVGSGGSFGASPLEQHIGLGRAARIVDIAIRWPSGTRQAVSGVALDQAIEVRESAAGFTRLARPPSPLAPPVISAAPSARPASR